jgi:hypothetical protein
MNAEYFAPREDIILQNEAPADFYIIVSGSMVKSLPITCFIIVHFQNLSDDLVTKNKWQSGCC